MRAQALGQELPPLPQLPAGEEAGHGVFVTLHRRGELRGCVGHLEGDRPLTELTQKMAVAASRDDPRFAPLGADELDGLQVEVSVLTDPVRVSATEVVAGRDGIVVRRGRSHAVLLPQVAVQYGWDSETLLVMACRKAGLAPGAWRDGQTEVRSFRAQVIREPP